jgi:methylated-DNA-[protein]-cysteine S-methyltransferase
MRGRWWIDANEHGVTGLRLERRGRASSAHGPGAVWRTRAVKELRAYFAGRLTAFSVPCDISALPFFTQTVLRFIAKIPYGETRSYRWIAQKLGNPNASRAVGNALARNPLPIIIPCHRVVRADGSIGPFALGSEWKKKLLSLEKRRAKSATSRKSVGPLIRPPAKRI